MARKPSRTQQRSDEIAELISEAGEKLVGLAINWFELNDKQGLSHARRMLWCDGMPHSRLEHLKRASVEFLPTRSFMRSWVSDGRFLLRVRIGPDIASTPIPRSPLLRRAGNYGERVSVI